MSSIHVKCEAFLYLFTRPAAGPGTRGKNWQDIRGCISCLKLSRVVRWLITSALQSNGHSLIMARFCRAWRGKNISAAGVTILLVCRHKIFKRYQVVRQILASQLKYREAARSLSYLGVFIGAITICYPPLI